jgi:hypothetical protein
LCMLLVLFWSFCFLFFLNWFSLCCRVGLQCSHNSHKN